MAAVRHLAFAKIAVLVSDLYRHVILHFCSKFRVNRPIWSRDIAKKTILTMVSVRHLEFEKFRFFCQIRMLGMKVRICVPNLIEIG